MRACGSQKWKVPCLVRSSDHIAKHHDSFDVYGAHMSHSRAFRQVPCWQDGQSEQCKLWSCIKIREHSILHSTRHEVVDQRGCVCSAWKEATWWIQCTQNTSKYYVYLKKNWSVSHIIYLFIEYPFFWILFYLNGTLRL